MRWGWAPPFEQPRGAARRDGRQDAARDDLVGDLAARPLADRAARRARGRAGQGDNLTGLLGGDPCGLAAAGRVGQPFLDAQLAEADGLQPEPSPPPLSGRPDVHREVTHDPGIGVPRRRSEHDARPQDHLLWRAVPPPQRL